MNFFSRDIFLKNDMKTTGKLMRFLHCAVDIYFPFFLNWGLNPRLYARIKQTGVDFTEAALFEHIDLVLCEED